MLTRRGHSSQSVLCDQHREPGSVLGCAPGHASQSGSGRRRPAVEIFDSRGLMLISSNVWGPRGRLLVSWEVLARYPWSFPVSCRHGMREPIHLGRTSYSPTRTRSSPRRMLPVVFCSSAILAIWSRQPDTPYELQPDNRCSWRPLALQRQPFLDHYIDHGRKLTPTMPTLRRYRVFISHAWKYGEDYWRVRSSSTKHHILSGRTSASQSTIRSRLMISLTNCETR